jgi:signal peptidase I
MAKKKPSLLGETARTVIFAVLIAFFIRVFAYEPFNIPSGSMKPTLLIGDYLFVSKFSYGYSRYSLPWGLPLIDDRFLGSPPKRGDVVVFKLPRDNQTDYIKRVIGLPGDSIQVLDGILQINGKPVARRNLGANIVVNENGHVQQVNEYVETLPNGVTHRIFEVGDNLIGDNTKVFEVPPGHYFMMGDNRDNSSDSRFGVGFVPFRNLVGRAEFLFFSHESSASLFKPWTWPTAIRYSRFFDGVE